MLDCKLLLTLAATCAFLGLVACQPSTSLDSTNEAPLGDLSLTMAATRAPMPSSMATVTTPPTVIASVPATKTVTPEPTATLTPLPTLPPDEALARVLELYETNGGCRFPCWWGFIPGEATWGEVRYLLSPIAHELNEVSGTESPEVLAVEVFVPQGDTMTTGRFERHIYVVENGIVQSIEGSTEPAFSLSPSAILREYGPPDEIYIRTGSGPINGFLSFTVRLFYQSSGFLILYSADGKATVEEGLVKACLVNDAPYMKLWSPERTRTFAEVDPSAADYAKPLAEVTELDIQTFYETFSDPNTSLCLETPQEHWPGY